MTLTRAAIALDCGTHAIRVIAYPEGGGAPLDLGSEEIRAYYPEPGFVELDADAVASTAGRLLRNAMTRLTNEGMVPVCLGITNMRETAVAWRRDTGKTIHGAIHWMSTQSQPQVDRWSADGTAERIRTTTGTSNHTFFFGSKIRWLMDNVEKARDLAAKNLLKVGTLESWLLFKLSGEAVHATDVSNASRYQMMDLGKLTWSPDLVDAVGIPMSSLPEIRPTHGVFAMTNPEVVGLSIPISGLIADQQASLFGHGAWAPGAVKATFGTSGVVCLNLGSRHRLEEGLVTSVAWSSDDGKTALYEIEASAFHSGSTINWLSSRLTNVNPWTQSMTRATAPAQLRPYVIPAFSQLGAPRWPSRSGGAVLGLQLDTTSEDIIRAGFETMAFQTFDTLRFLASSPEIISVDGGGAVSNYLCQTLANLTGAIVSRPTSPEMTALGTAQMAVKGINEDIELWQRADRADDFRFLPEDDDGYSLEGYTEWSNLVHRVLADNPGETR